MEAARVPQATPTMKVGRPFLGSILLRKGVLTEEQLDATLAQKEVTGERLGEILLRLGLVDETALAMALAEQYGVDFVDLDRFSPNPAAVAMLPERHASRYQAVPVRFVDDALLIAVADPTDLMVKDELGLAIGMPLRLAVSTRSAVRAGLGVAYGTGQAAPSPVGEIAGARQQTQSARPSQGLGEVRADAQGAPAVDFVNRIISLSIQERASDIHVEPQRDRVVVRARIDGVLREIAQTDSSLANAISARLKIMSELDIAERRVPQDGRVSVTFNGEPVDLRVAVMPTSWGEQVVLRVLYRSAHQRDLSQLGMASDTAAAIRRALTQPYGMVISSGPTGSGKTTTLYAGLDMLNSTSRAIMTIEDPVEYQVEGLCQIDVNPKAGLTFASGLRTILRSDPDVLLVGEIRDGETAQIAVQAALTGHLVLTTLHANSAVRSVARLTEMGVEKAMIGNTVNCIIAQRLARRLCVNCRAPYEASAEMLMCDLDNGQPLEVPEMTLYRAHGCPSCANTGYRGRVAFYEVLDLSKPRLRRLVEGPLDELQDAALAEGLRTLSQDGLRLCIEGLTSLDEIRRIVGTSV
ncbi:MAG: GspE/PulE family protein [Thermoleophilia bacterium]